MSFFRASFFFKDDQGRGWSETYYNTSGSQEQVLLNSIALVPSSVSVRGINTMLEYVRVSSDDPTRDSLVYLVPTDNQRPKRQGLPKSDIADTCLVVRLQSSPQIFRVLSLRGIPDDIVTEAGKFTPSADWSAQFALFAGNLRTLNFSIRSRDPAAVSVPIATITQVPPVTELLITTAANHNLAVGQPVLLRGLKPGGVISGIARVFSTPTAATFIILTNRIIPTFSLFGRITPVVYRNTVIATAQVIRASERKAGRPFDSARGKQKGRPRF